MGYWLWHRGRPKQAHKYERGWSMFMIRKLYKDMSPACQSARTLNLLTYGLLCDYRKNECSHEACLVVVVCHTLAIFAASQADLLLN